MVERVLITGGAGYIGSVLTPLLLKQGYAVTVLDNFSFKQNSLLDCFLNHNFTIIRGDCRDRDTLKSAMNNCDTLIPLAALVGAPACKQDQVTAKSLNLDAIKLLLSMRSTDQRILYPTTNSGYGVGEQGIFCTEKTPLRPISLYGVTKVEAEKAILDAGNAITFRLATVFGLSTRMRLDLLVNDFVYRAVHDRTVVVFEGHAKRNYLHIQDAARVFLHGMTHFEVMKDQPYNAGLSDANLSKLELCEEIKKQLPGFVYLEASVGEDPDKRDYIVSNQKIEAAGFETSVSLAQGITELIKGYTILRNERYTNL